MGPRAHVLCPIDFSTPSRAALRYACALAEHFGARLTIVTINDPLLTEVAGLRMGSSWMVEDTERELRRFVAETFEQTSSFQAEIGYEVAEGKPAPQILRIARERACDLLVMGTHGMTGVRKMFFGSTTERVLRETSVPVLLTPPTDTGPLTLDHVKRALRRVLVPVDMVPETRRQLQVAQAVAEGLEAQLLLLHVIEPVHFPLPAYISLPSVDAERRVRAEQLLEALVSMLSPTVRPEALIAYGNPAEEIAKTARDRKAGLIVVGLHSSPLAGPRMGSVTYRVLCLASTLVLALPPAAAQPADKATAAKSDEILRR